MRKKFTTPGVLFGIGGISLAVALFMLQGGISNMNPLYILMAILGIVLMLYGLFKTKAQSGTETNIIDDIKQDLIKIKNIQRDTAIKQSKQVFHRGTTEQIFIDIYKLFCGERDTKKLKEGIMDIPMGNNDAVMLLEGIGNMVDNHNCGLKVALESNEVYKSLESELEQKRLMLKKPERKRRIIQDNIHKVRVLSYGINSTIILRNRLEGIPDIKNNIPVETLNHLQGAEIKAERIVNSILDNIEKKQC